jgi:hypothetical protein
MAIGTRGLLGSILAVITLFTVPIMLLNTFGGIVAGIWLAILGEWWALGTGAVLLLVSMFGLSFVLMPGILVFGMPGAYLLSRGSVLAYPFALLSSLYTFAVMTVWSVWVFNLYMQYADARSFFPLLLWSYGTATGPWTYMASKERDNTASTVSAFAAQLGYIVMIVMAVFFQPTLLDLAIGFGAVMLVALMLQFAVWIAMTAMASRSAKMEDTA